MSNSARVSLAHSGWFKLSFVGSITFTFAGLRLLSI